MLTAMNKRTIRPKTELPESTRIEGARLLRLCAGIPKVPSATRTIPVRRNPAERLGARPSASAIS
jgi:hypothetical protein